MRPPTRSQMNVWRDTVSVSDVTPGDAPGRNKSMSNISVCDLPMGHASEKTVPIGSRLAVSTVLVVAGLLGPALAAEPTVSLTLKDHKFAPSEVTIPADTRVRVLVKNLDATPAEFESDDFRAEKVIPAGKEVTVFVGPLKAGSYEFHDEYHEAESKSRLIVQ
jgi:plastocyanin